jgi:hypothetical protein
MVSGSQIDVVQTNGFGSRHAQSGNAIKHLANLVAALKKALPKRRHEQRVHRHRTQRVQVEHA